MTAVCFRDSADAWIACTPGGGSGSTSIRKRDTLLVCLKGNERLALSLLEILKELGIRRQDEGRMAIEGFFVCFH